MLFLKGLFTAVSAYLKAHKFVAFLVKLGVSMAASYAINKLLAPKLPKDNIGSNPLILTRNPIAPRRVVYGTTRLSGPMLFANVSGPSNKYLHLIVALAGHEVDAIGDTFWFDDKQFEVPYPGNSTSHATYGPLLLLNKHRGEAGQSADGQLITDLGPLWTSNHKLESIAYIMLRMTWDQNAFPGGIPNITALVRGKKCYDPRDAGTRWTRNPALCLRDYLVSTSYGLAVPTASIDDTSFTAAANICDEAVGIGTSFTRSCDVTISDRVIVCANTSGMFPGLAVAGTGIAAGTLIESVDVDGAYFTVTADPTATNAGVTLTFGDTEARYAMDGSFETDAQPATVIEYILATMAGTLVFVGGKWRVKAGAYESPTITLNEDDLRGPITVQTKDSMKDACNGVKGTFANPVEKYQMTDFAAVTSATYLAEDQGIELTRDVTMPFVTSHSQAQRLAKIELERARLDTTVQLQCKLTALRVQAGDTVAVTNARLGWTAKAFLVTNFAFAIADDGTVGCDLTLRETASTVWDWDETTEEDPYTPSVPPDVPDFPGDPDPDYDDLVYDYPVADIVLECRWRAGINAMLSPGTARAEDSGYYLETDVNVAWNGANWIVSGTYTAHSEGAGLNGKIGDCSSSGVIYAPVLVGAGGGVTVSGAWSVTGSVGYGEVGACVTGIGCDCVYICVPGTGGWSAWATADAELTCDSNCVGKQDSDLSTCEFQEAQYRITRSGLNADANYYLSLQVYRRPIGSSDPFGHYETLDFVVPTDGAGDLEYTDTVPNLEGWETCVGAPELWGSVAL